MSRIQRGMILLFVVLLICVGLGIADFTMSSNGSIKEGFVPGMEFRHTNHPLITVNRTALLGNETTKTMTDAY